MWDNVDYLTIILLLERHNSKLAYEAIEASL